MNIFSLFIIYLLTLPEVFFFQSSFLFLSFYVDSFVCTFFGGEVSGLWICFYHGFFWFSGGFIFYISACDWHGICQWFWCLEGKISIFFEKTPPTYPQTSDESLSCPHGCESLLPPAPDLTLSGSICSLLSFVVVSPSGPSSGWFWLMPSVFRCPICHSAPHMTLHRILPAALVYFYMDFRNKVPPILNFARYHKM